MVCNARAREIPIKKGRSKCLIRCTFLSKCFLAKVSSEIVGPSGNETGGKFPHVAENFLPRQRDVSGVKLRTVECLQVSHLVDPTRLGAAEYYLLLVLDSDQYIWAQTSRGEEEI